MVVQLVGDADEVVVDVAEVDDLVVVDQRRSRFVSWLKTSRTGLIARRISIRSRLSVNSRWSGVSSSPR